jgi:hypothetical protein
MVPRAPRLQPKHDRTQEEAAEKLHYKARSRGRDQSSRKITILHQVVQALLGIAKQPQHRKTLSKNFNPNDKLKILI